MSSVFRSSIQDYLMFKIIKSFAIICFIGSLLGCKKDSGKKAAIPAGSRIEYEVCTNDDCIDTIWFTNAGGAITTQPQIPLGIVRFQTSFEARTDMDSLVLKAIGWVSSRHLRLVYDTRDCQTGTLPAFAIQEIFPIIVY